MKTIIAGSRNINSLALVQKAIEKSGFQITEVFCGDAQGVDQLGANWAELNGIPVRHFPAKWEDINVKGAVVRQGRNGKYNVRAGLDRNEQMAKQADALIAIWDGNSSGTGHMILQGHKYGLRLYVKIIKE